MSQDRFKDSHFPKCIVLQAVYLYLLYSLSYRDIEKLMNERGINIDHSIDKTGSNKAAIEAFNVEKKLSLIIIFATEPKFCA